MSQGLLHRHLITMLFEICAHRVRIDVLYRDDDIGMHEFYRVDEEQWVTVVFIFHPKRNDFIVAMQFACYSYATFGYFKFHEIRWMAREDGDSHRSYCDNHREKNIMKENAHEANRNSNNAERPKPIATAFDMLVLIGTPTKYHM